MPSIRSTAAAAVLTLALPALAVAAPWQIDPSHTQITFEVDHLGFSNTNGIFREFEAEIDFDPENIEATEVSFTIDAASIDTFWDKRDEHIRSGDFLDVENHPEITFESTSVTQTGDNTADVTGNLTIRDTTQEVTFKATLNNLGPSPFNPEQQIAGFELVGEIDRTQFGIDFGAPAIGTVIPFTVDLEMSPGEADPA